MRTSGMAGHPPGRRLTRQVVPHPGADRMVTSPFRLRARSSMPIRPKPAIARAVWGRRFRPDAAAVVGDLDLDARGVAAQRHARLGRRRMPDDVVHALLDDAKDVDRGVGRDRVVDVVDLRSNGDAARLARPPEHAFDRCATRQSCRGDTDGDRRRCPSSPRRPVPRGSRSGRLDRRCRRARCPPCGPARGSAAGSGRASRAGRSRSGGARSPGFRGAAVRTPAAARVPGAHAARADVPVSAIAATRRQSGQREEPGAPPDRREHDDRQASLSRLQTPSLFAAITWNSYRPGGIR